MHTIANWHNLNRISNWQIKSQEVDWPNTFQMLNYHNSPLSRYTNPTQSRIKTFKIKLILDELPTRINLYHRQPLKNQDPRCYRCHTEIEDSKHLLTCPFNTNPLEYILTQNLTRTIIKFNLSNFDSDTFIDNFISTHITGENIIPIGIITKTTTIPHTQHPKPPKAKSPTVYFNHHLIKTIREDIWKPRCEAQTPTTTPLHIPIPPRPPSQATEVWPL